MSALKRIVIVDDDVVVRTGLRGILGYTRLYEIVSEASNGEEFLGLLERTAPEFVILDLMMPGMPGCEVARRAIELQPSIKVIIFSALVEREELSRLLDMGIFGYILKTEGFQQIIRAMTDAASCTPYFSPELVGMVIRHNMPGKHLVDFSQREMEILQLMCNGFSLHEIAERLFISNRTVEKHRSNMLTKASQKSTLGLVLYALKNELVSLEDIGYRSTSEYVHPLTKEQLNLFNNT